MGKTQIAGQAAEDHACHYLQAKGLTLITRNYRNRYGEIDLIMQDGKYWVFAEVRLRNNRNFISGAESVSDSKQKKLIRTATVYLQEKKVLNTQRCRLDVLDLQQESGTFTVNWIKNAFSE